MAKKKEETGELSLLEEMTLPVISFEMDPEKVAIMKATADGIVKKYPAGYAIKSKIDLETVKTDISMCVKMRTSTGDWYTKTHANVKLERDRVYEMFAPAEARTKEIKAAYDDAEAKRIEAERLEKLRIFKEREKMIYDLGGAWRGSMYQLETATCSKLDLETDEKWPFVLAEFEAAAAAVKAAKDLADKLAAEKAEKERVEKLERDRVEKENEALRAKLAAMEKAAAAEAPEVPAPKTADIDPMYQPVTNVPEFEPETAPVPPISEGTAPYDLAVLKTEFGAISRAFPAHRARLLEIFAEIKALVS